MQGEMESERERGREGEGETERGREGEQRGDGRQPRRPDNPKSNTLNPLLRPRLHFSEAFLGSTLHVFPDF